MLPTAVATRFELRPSTLADADFVYRVAEITARPLVESSGRKWSQAKMQQRCADDAVDAQGRIVTCEGQSIGFLKVVPQAESIRLDALLLQPAFQRRGIGSSLLAQIKAQSRERGMPIELGVFEANANAKVFWEHHGFVVRNHADLHYWMSRAP